ncbi:WD repeat-containing protein 63 [Globomyces sp. JEL0801]|nr:WD repeat-containing protein 63 [Globomyces sp. JEL0801]
MSKNDLTKTSQSNLRSNTALTQSSSKLARTASQSLSKSNLSKSISNISGSRANLAKTGSIASSKPNLARPESARKPKPASDDPPPLPEKASENNPSNDYYHNKQLEGIFPMFLTGQSQALAKVTIGEDVTDQKMFRMVPKSDLIQDMATRLAISDFTPAKQHIMPPEVAKEEAVEGSTATKLKNAPKAWKSLGSEREIEMEWTKSMGDLVSVAVSKKYSDFKSTCKFGDRDAQDGFLEIKSYKDPTFDLGRMEIQVGVQAVPELKSSKTQTAWYGFKIKFRYRPINFSCQYEALEMDPQEQEEIQQTESLEMFMLAISARFERNLQQNEIMDIFLDDYMMLGEEEMAIEHGSQTVLQEYQSFTDLINSKDKCISCINWHPTQKGILAVSCTHAFGFEDRIHIGFTTKSKQSVIIIWSFQDPINPQLILEAPEDVTCFQINPLDPSIIVAGCINGQIVLWDISEFHEKLKSSRKADADGNPNEDTKDKKSAIPSIRFAVVSSIEASHRASITDIRWLPKHFEVGNNGEVLENGENGDKQIITSSLDGTIAIWDIRFKKDWKSLDLAWRPFMRIPLTAMDNSFDYSVTKVCLRTTANEEQPAGKAKDVKPSSPSDSTDPNEKKKVTSKPWSSKFYCATEEGDLIYADWTSEKVSEEKSSKVECSIGAHFGPMTGLERSPFFPDIFLSIGGWSFHIWKEKYHMAPLLSSGQAPSGITCGQWSPTRPGVFYIGRADGMLEVWDLLDRSHTATTIQSVATTAVSFISKGAQQYIGVGDDSGTLHILETPKNLQKITKNEKAAIGAFFDREARRIVAGSERKKAHIKDRAAFEASILEATNAALKAAAAKVEEAEAVVPTESDGGEDAKEEKAYLAMEKA